MNNKFPKSKTAENIRETFFVQPVAKSGNTEEENIKIGVEDKSFEDTRQDASVVNANTGSELSKQPKSNASVLEEESDKSETKAVRPGKSKEKASKIAKQSRLLTYMTEEDYEEFEEVADEMKRIMRKESGKTFRATHVSEVMIRLGVIAYKKDRKEFLKMVRELPNIG